MGCGSTYFGFGGGGGKCCNGFGTAGCCEDTERGGEAVTIGLGAGGRDEEFDATFVAEVETPLTS